MENWICTTCGSQFAESEEQPHGAWFATIVDRDAKNAVLRSADRYIRALGR